MWSVYVCIGVGDDVGGMFAINSSSGELYVSDVVDREHPALIRSQGVIHIVVNVRHSLSLSLSLSLCEGVEGHGGRWGHR